MFQILPGYSQKSFVYHTDNAQFLKMTEKDESMDSAEIIHNFDMAVQ